MGIIANLGQDRKPDDFYLKDGQIEKSHTISWTKRKSICKTIRIIHPYIDIYDICVPYQPSHSLSSIEMIGNAPSTCQEHFREKRYDFYTAQGWAAI